MSSLAQKIIYLGTGVAVGSALVFFFRPVNQPIVLFADQNSESRKAPTKNLTIAEKAQLIVKMERGERKLAAMKQLGMDLEWFPVPIDEVLECRKSIPYDALRQVFDQGAMPVLARWDPNRVLKLIEEGPWWKDQWLVEKSALLEIAKTNPESIINRIQNLKKPHVRYDSVMDIVLNQLAKTSPQTALKYAKSLPDGKAKRRVYEQTMKARAQRDPIGSSEWLQSMPKGESRDGAIGAFVSTFRFENPGDAFIWAADIDDPKLRMLSLKGVVGVWLQQGGFGAARNAVENSKLTQAERNLLLQEVSKSK